MKNLYSLLILTLITYLLPILSFAQCSDTFLETRKIVLDQKTQLLGEVESATKLVGGTLAIATADPGVYLFDTEGTFLRKLGRAGRGPSEYQGPLTVRAAGTNIAVWDAGNRKLLLFDQNGNVQREWTRLGRAVSDFVVRNDTLYAYHSGGLRKQYVSVYRYASQGEAHTRFGTAPGAHLPLSLLAGSDALAYNDVFGRLLYASPAERTVHVYDPDGGTRDSFRIDDPEFNVEPVSEYTTPSDVNANLLGAVEQAFQSSRFYFLQTIQNRVLSVFQHGKLTYKKSLAESVGSQGRTGTNGTLDAGGVHTNSRFLNVHLHTFEGRPLRCESLSFRRGETESDSPIAGPTPWGFLVSTTQMEGDDVEYTLTEYSVPERLK